MTAQLIWFGADPDVVEWCGILSSLRTLGRAFLATVRRFLVRLFRRRAKFAR
jgi:hypothetical protein